MNWTCDLPTRPGLYAWRGRKESGLLTVLPSDEGLIVDHPDPDAVTFLHEWTTGEWLGPLPE